MTGLPQAKQWLGLLGLTAAALLVHGYHLGIEDEAIYLPAIKLHLEAGLYPHDAELFLFQTRGTLFDEIVAGTVKWTGASLGAVTFLFHVMAIFAFLAGCLAVSRKLFAAAHERWSAVALVAALLTLPVAGTALYLADQHLHPRTAASAALLYAVAFALDRRWLPTAAMVVAAAIVHPQMAFYGAGLLAVVAWRQRNPEVSPALLLASFPVLFGSMSDAWRSALRSRAYDYPLEWHWYEWLGIVGPLLILGWLARFTRREERLALVCRRLVIFGVITIVAGLLVSVPPPLERFTPLQPMRGFHLLYVVFALIAGGLIARHWTRTVTWRWVVLFAALAVAMGYGQRQLFPHSSHVDWPWRTPQNDYVAAFRWIRDHTPRDALFALDPEYMQREGADYYGFRAWAERSMMADATKDLGISGILVFRPDLAERISAQVEARTGWRQFGADDFLRLRREFGVSWVVLERGHRTGLPCPYVNRRVQVCRIE